MWLQERFDRDEDSLRNIAFLHPIATLEDVVNEILKREKKSNNQILQELGLVCPTG